MAVPLPETPPQKKFLAQRCHRVCVEAPCGVPTSPSILQALELELASVGWLFSAELRRELEKCSDAVLTDYARWLPRLLLESVGGHVRHEPLFRRFPEGIPADTQALWWSKVLCHFLQQPDQPCLFCDGQGCTHVLNPCAHVVCDRCFDGANYSACPVCEHKVDRSSPFFKPEESKVHTPQAPFKRLHLCADPQLEFRAFFERLCRRPQALSPDDRQALLELLDFADQDCLSWLPEEIPLRENVATIFGSLAIKGGPQLLIKAQSHFTSATDVLRFIAALSGADPALIASFKNSKISVSNPEPRFKAQVEKALALYAANKQEYLKRFPQYSINYPPPPKEIVVNQQIRRFKVAKLSRAWRRHLLEALESFPQEALFADLRRHANWWIWVGEFLHPHEYAKRFPKTAEAFRLIRGKGPEGQAAPIFQNWNSRIEQALKRRQADEMIGLLRQRPGEFARRLDHSLRILPLADQQRILSAFLERQGEMKIPVLLTLYAHLGSRGAHHPRFYWPKGQLALGAGGEDRRPLLDGSLTEPFRSAIRDELLRRFSSLPKFPETCIDASLEDIAVPFNERTAAAAAVQVPRGSHLPMMEEGPIRLFLHWCQPKDGQATDLDLSIAFYSADWQEQGSCSYYALQKLGAKGEVIAQSSGDLRNAPWPDGASEFVDLHPAAARREGIRYAVAVINSYAGLPFDKLERAFAGWMELESDKGAIFEPTRVKNRFQLRGENGVYLPFVVDLEAKQLHWLDLYSKGQFAMNNAANSSKAITTLCPRLIRYFASGCRANMKDLALLHAAARSDRVRIRERDGSWQVWQRREGESHSEFHARLDGMPGTSASPATSKDSMMAFLAQGDLELPPESSAYVLFTGLAASTQAAADWLAIPAKNEG
jgi:hypothetical protein